MAFLTSCSHQEHEEHQEHVKGTFKVTQAIQKDTIINEAYVSQIRAYQHIELRALEKGYLQEIFVDEGQHVKKGQLLFQIQPSIYKAEASSAKAKVENAQAEINSAESEVKFAQVEYNNVKALAEKDIVSQSEAAMALAKLQKAKAELQKAKAELSKSNSELKLAQTHLSFTEIRAPFDGIVGKFEDVRLGSLLDEGELLTTLSDNSKMWVYFNVPEAEYLDYAMREKKENEHVHLQLANSRLFPEEGIIETIESDFNNKTGNIAFRATFSNPKGLLRHGQTGSILWPKEFDQVTMIPQKATFEVLEKKFVYVVDNDGVVKSREVKIEDEINHIYLISEGLKPNEKFILEGIRKVKNGEKIQFKYISPEKVFSDLDLHAE